MTIHQSTATEAVKAAALPKSSKAGAKGADSSRNSAQKNVNIKPLQAQSAIKNDTQGMAHAATPRDVFDCIAAGIPRADWESALDHDAAKQWSHWLGEAGSKPDAQNEASQAQIKTKILNLSDEVWHLDAARSALSAVATMTDQCAFYGGSNLDVPAQDMANLLRVVHLELERRTQVISSALNEMSMAWRVKA